MNGRTGMLEAQHDFLLLHHRFVKSAKTVKYSP